MTDRELLVLAAKAAELELRPHINAKLFRDLKFVANGNNWNPLTDDGDALRLAVDLHISIDQVCESTFPYAYAATITDGYEEPYADHDGNQYAATRRAVVRAAAAIASTQKGESK